MCTNDVLRVILETIYRALAFHRVLFCLRDTKSETLTGRFGLGEDASALAAVFKVPLRMQPGARVPTCSAPCARKAPTR